MDAVPSIDDFTTLMRKKTKRIHDISDVLVQSKFVIGLIDDRVWAEGLLIFNDIFRFLEECMENLEGTNIVRFHNSELLRTQYFEADLELYYGPNWREKNPRRTCVQNYIFHLQELRENNPDLLIAYIYHLYLGLLSGGRILRRKQKLMSFSKFSKRSSVVDFDNETVGRLKKFIKETTNMIVQDMDDKKKNELLDESVTVFKLNCDIIRSVSSADTVFKKVKTVFYTATFITLFSVFYWYWTNSDENES